MTHWIKLYTEILNDPKVGRLSYQLRWRFTEALLLAGAQEDEGYLPDAAAAAYMAHCNESDILADWRALATYGLLEETPDGWLVVNFAKRQAPSEVAQRVRLHRERKQILQNSYSNVTVTTPEENRTEQNRRDTESDTDTEQKRINEDRGNFDTVKELIEKHVGLPSMPKDVPALQELAAIDDLQEADIIGAIAWHKEQGRVVYGAAHLLGSIKHNRAARIQARAQAPPGRNGKPPKRTGAIAASKARLAAEEAAQHGNEE